MVEWLADTTANRHKQTYVKGFIDISGSDLSGNALTVRNGNVSVNNIDASTINGVDVDGTYVIFVANPVANFGAIGLGPAITGGSSGGNDYLLCYKNNYTVKTLKAGAGDRQSGIYLTPGLWQVQLWISNIEETGSVSDAYFFWLDADSGNDMDTAERITKSRMYVAASNHTPPSMTHYVSVPDGDAQIWACDAGTAFDPILDFGGLTYAFRQVKSGTWNGSYTSTGAWTEYTGW